MKRGKPKMQRSKGKYVLCNPRKTFEPRAAKRKDFLTINKSAYLSIFFFFVALSSGFAKYSEFHNSPNVQSGNNEITAIKESDGPLTTTPIINNPIPDEKTAEFATNASALHFDGIDDYVQSSTNVPLFGSQPTTFELWVNPSVENSTYRSPIGLGSNKVYLKTNGDLRLHGESQFSDKGFGYNLPENQWTHIAVSYDGVNQLNFYINGQPAPVSTHTQSINFINQPVYVGNRGSLNSSTFWNGAVDEVRIWHEERTAAEILANYDKELAVMSECMPVYYKFNQGMIGSDNTAITTALDESVNLQNDGSLHNLALTGTTSNWVAGASIMAQFSISEPFGEIGVSGNGMPIADEDNMPDAADHTDFGSIAVGNGLVRTFTINNSGTGDLIISSIGKSGSGAAQFVINGITLPATVAASGSATFTIEFAPSSGGTHQADIIINNNDCDENPFNYRVEGVAIPCGISITNIATQEEQCPGATNGSILVSASCTTCANGTDDLEYAINGGSFQASNTFTGLTAGSYTVVVRDENSTSCQASNVVTINQGVDDTPPQITCPMDISVNTDSDICGAVLNIETPTVSDNCSFLVLGNALNFDGVNDIAFVNASSPINSQNQTQRTAEVYFRVDDKNINTRKQVIWEEGGSVNGLNIYVFDGKLYMGAYSGSTNWNPIGTWIETDAIQSGQWHNAVIVFDGNLPANQRLKGYLDGNLIATTTTGGSVINAHPGANAVGGLYEHGVFHDGADFNTSGHYFGGDIDEIRLWTVARSEAELQATNTVQLNGNEPGLILYYTFDQGTTCGNNTGVNFLDDMTATNLNGTLQGFNLDGSTGCNSNWTNGAPVLTSEITLINNFTQTASASGTYPVGTTAVTWTATDQAGNTSSCVQNITVSDNDAPTAICQNITVELDNSGSASITPASIDGGSTDNCGITDYGISNSEFGCNTASYALDFDGSNDYVDLPNNIVSGLNDFTFETWINYTDNGYWTRVFDIGINTFYNMFLTPKANRSPNIGRPRFALTTNGISGEQLIDSNIPMPTGWHHFAVTIDYDDQTGVAVGTMYIDGNVVGVNNNMTITPADLGVTTKNFLGKSQYSDPYLEATLDETRIWSVARSQAQIQGFMNSAIGGNEFGLFLYYNYEDGPGSQVTTDLSPSGNDGSLINMNLSNAYVTSAVVNVLGVGDHSVTLTVGDAAGNSSSCTATVSVEDNIAPSVTCQNTTIQLDASGDGSIEVDDVVDSYSDNCGVAILGISQSQFDCQHVGSNTITVTATDVNGNSMTCTSTVTVEDNVLPIAICKDITVELGANGVASITVAEIDNGSNDACGIQSQMLDVSTFDCSNAGANTVELTIIDNYGNQNTCTSTVNVVDNEAPVVPTIGVVNEECSTVLTIPVAFDNCDGEIVGTTTDPLNYNTEGTYIVTWTFEDFSGNTSTQTQNVVINDVTNPTITCPSDLNISATSPAGAIATFMDPIGTDNCSGVTIIQTGGIASGSVFPIGTTINTFEVADDAGNTAECSFSVTVGGVAPNIICPSDIVVDAEQGVCDAIVTFEAIETTGVPASTIIYTHDPGLLFSIGTTEVTAIATNAIGSADCTFTVTVEDNEVPEAICQDQVIQLDASGNASITASQIDNNSYDNCGIASVQFVDFNNFIMNSGFESNAAWVFNNGAQLNPAGNPGNSVWLNSNGASWSDPNISQDIIGLIIGETYTITGQTRNMGNCCGAFIGAPGLAIDLDGSEQIVIPNPGTVWTDFSYTFVATATSHTLRFRAEINGTDIDMAVDNVEVLGAPSALGNTLSFDCTNVGANPVILQIVDNSNNFATCSATVTVQDLIDPEIPVLADINEECMAVVPVPQTNDNCGTITGTTTSPLNYNTQGSYIITWTFDDGNGNIVTANQNVIIEDVTDPVINCPSDVTLLATSAAGAVVTFTTPVGTDNCSATTTQTAGLASGVTFPIGTTINTFEVEDDAGNTASCSFTVTVSGAAPDIVCPSDIVVDATAGQCDAVVAFAATETTGIPASVITYSHNSGSTFPVGSTTVTATATNTVGSTDCTFTVTVEDNEVPEAICQDQVLQLDASGNASITASQIDNNSYDNCGIASVQFVDFNNFIMNSGFESNAAWVFNNGAQLNPAGNPGNCVWLNSNGASWSDPNISQDIIGLIIGETYTITGQTQNRGNCCGAFIGAPGLAIDLDGTEQIVIPNPGTVWTDFSYTFVATATSHNLRFRAEINGTDVDMAVDNVEVQGAPSALGNSLSFDCTNVGANPVILQIVDNNNNFSTCTSTVTVEDNVSPIAICQDITIQLDANGTASITMADIDNGSNDACGIQSLVLDQTSFDCSEVGMNTVTMTVTDNNDNVSNCTSTVIVEDNVSPVAICQDITIQLDANGEASITIADIDNGSNDACGIQSLVLDETSFDCSEVGMNTVTMTVTDNNDNVSTCTSTVTVEDNVLPIAICQDITIQLDANGAVSITTADIDNGSNDACGIQSLELDEATFDCSEVGQNTVIMTVTDNSGNVSTCTATVSIEDDSSPVLENCPENATYCGAQPVFWNEPEASDNCGFTVISSHNSGDVFNVGVTTVVYTVIDDSGNKTTCSFDITINSLPEVTILESVLPDFCQGYAQLEAIVTNEDDLEAGISFTWSGGLGNDAMVTPFANGTYNVTVTDGNGCQTVTGYTLNVDPSESLSGYVILSGKDANFRRSTVGSGGVGVFGNNKKAKLNYLTNINTFVKAPVIQMDYSSNAANTIYGQADVTLPQFIDHIWDCDEDVDVDDGETATIDGNLYDEIEMEDNSTLIINTPELYIDQIEMGENTQLIFLQPTVVVVKNKVKIEDNSVVNIDGQSVLFYIGKELTVEKGVHFTANVFAKKKIYAKKAKSYNQTYMNGMFITLDKLDSREFVNWNQAAMCNPDPILAGPADCGGSGDPEACDNVTYGGIISGDEVLCGNDNNPALITSNSLPSGGSGNIEYMWMKSTVSATPPSVNFSQWQVIPGASGPVYNPGNITETTWFVRCARREYCSAWGGESNVIEKGYDQSCDTFCDAYGNNTNYEWIQMVSMAEINNNSGNDNGYGDYTNQFAVVVPGQNYNIELQPGFNGAAYTEYWSVWVDWNQDGQFNPVSELAAYGSGTGTLNETISIPFDALPGETLMRVTMKYGSWPLPCEVFSYGEVEDYTLIVKENESLIDISSPAGTPEDIIIKKERVRDLDALDMRLTVFPNPVSDYLNIELLGTGEHVTVTIYDNVGRVVWTKESTEANPVFKIDVAKEQFTDGFYTVKALSDGKLTSKTIVIVK